MVAHCTIVFAVSLGSVDISFCYAAILAFAGLSGFGRSDHNP